MMEELSLNILDVAENSVSAGASLVEIEITEDTKANTLGIIIADDGCGMTKEQVAQVCDPFYTARTTRKVGLGVPFFKMAAELSGGSFIINSVPGLGTEVRAVFQLNHIDRMPLGDMTATMLTLIQGSPEIDFMYTHSIDKKTMVMDTRVFRAILEGVPLSEPEVLAFIRNFMEENMAAIK